MISKDCPVCNTNLDNSVSFDDITVCECGWSGSYENKTLEKKAATKVSKNIIIMSSLILGVFLQIANWDSYSLEIIPLKAKQWFSAPTEASLNRIIAICKDRKKLSCIEGAYEDLVRLAPKNQENLAALARAQVDNKEIFAASLTFARYIKAGGKDIDVTFDYAKVLSALGKTDSAERYFKYILQRKPRTLQPKVMRSYVNMLIKDNQLSKARGLIYKYRKISKRAAFFLDKQLKEINQKLKVAKL